MVYYKIGNNSGTIIKMKKQLKKSLFVIIFFIFLTDFSTTLFFTQIFNDSSNELDVNLSYFKDFGLKHFSVGVMCGPFDIDPVHCSDSNSRDVIYQVAEGLFMHDFSDPELKVVPRLAADYGIWDGTGMHYTLALRQDVLFHDGTKFNASSVKWNFERINWFLNATGTLNTTLVEIQSIWKLPNGSLFLDAFNPVSINTEYNVTINLIAPYTILESVLCRVNAFMLSPISTPRYESINTTTGAIVGTGPFIYDYYSPNDWPYGHVNFHRWEGYWREPAYLSEIEFVIINDGTTRNNALLNGRIDFLMGPLSSMLPTFRNNSVIFVEENKVSSLSYYHVCMNNKKINQTWRQAISYAINYSYIMEELLQGDSSRSNGPLAPNFPGNNISIKAAAWDLAKARQILINAGIPGTGGLIANNDTTGPFATAWKSADLATWNYSYDEHNNFRENLGVLLANNLDLIGIEVVDQPMSWSDFIYRAYGYLEPGGFDSLELFWIGKSPAFLDPFNIISTLFSNQSAFNSAQYHNHQVEMWLEETLKEKNPLERDKTYSKILHQIVEVDMAHAFVFHPMLVSVYHMGVKGYYQNALNQLYCYTITVPHYSGLITDDITGYSFLYMFLVSLVFITYIYIKNRKK